VRAELAPGCQPSDERQRLRRTQVDSHRRGGSGIRDDRVDGEVRGIAGAVGWSGDRYAEERPQPEIERLVHALKLLIDVNHRVHHIALRARSQPQSCCAAGGGAAGGGGGAAGGFVGVGADAGVFGVQLSAVIAAATKRTRRIGLFLTLGASEDGDDLGLFTRDLEQFPSPLAHVVPPDDEFLPLFSGGSKHTQVGDILPMRRIGTDFEEPGGCVVTEEEVVRP